ncbi:MAG: hypothetical protein GWN58_28065, partial [Anaerolineae bacterium]|nr:hypothetical protein [Anaerolineae bacterium]
KRGESYTLDRFRFKVVRADARRIHLLQLTLLPKESLKERAEPPSA